MINPVHRLSTALCIIGIILMVLVMMGVGGYTLLITAMGVELIGFTWSYKLDDEWITPRGLALCVIFWALVTVWGVMLSLQ